MVVYLNVLCIDFAFFYDFDIIFWNSLDGVVFFVFILFSSYISMAILKYCIKIEKTTINLLQTITVQSFAQ